MFRWLDVSQGPVCNTDQVLAPAPFMLQVFFIRAGGVGDRLSLMGHCHSPPCPGTPTKLASATLPRSHTLPSRPPVGLVASVICTVRALCHLPLPVPHSMQSWHALPCPAQLVDPRPVHRQGSSQAPGVVHTGWISPRSPHACQHGFGTSASLQPKDGTVTAFTTTPSTLHPRSSAPAFPPATV